MKPTEITFEGKSFCFTGKLSDLKRTHAERCVRARGGYTTGKTINESLDYLVIGSIPSIGWKHGNYGNKIEKALNLKALGTEGPELIPEVDFMEALAYVPETSSGDIEDKIVVCNYKFFAREGQFDKKAIEVYLDMLSDSRGCHVSVYTDYASIFAMLYTGNCDDFDDEQILVRIRVVKQIHIDEDTQATVDEIAMAFEAIDGVDGDLEFFERQAGTASFLKVLSEIPESRRISTNKE